VRFKFTVGNNDSSGVLLGLASFTNFSKITMKVLSLYCFDEEKRKFERKSRKNLKGKKLLVIFF
jgi:hypothetical protein